MYHVHMIDSHCGWGGHTDRWEGNPLLAFTLLFRPDAVSGGQILPHGAQ